MIILKSPLKALDMQGSPFICDEAITVDGSGFPSSEMDIQSNPSSNLIHSEEWEREREETTNQLLCVVVLVPSLFFICFLRLVSLLF